tara:strand:- start:175 stop:1215 length:1041 start_codon:yes stop_codon:yes gene_type:complete
MNYTTKLNTLEKGEDSLPLRLDIISNTNYDNDNTLVNIEELTNTIQEKGKITFDTGSTGEEGVYCKLRVGILRSERKYQRFISPSTIKRAKRLNLELLQPLVVWRRPMIHGGQNVVVDGQHKAVMGYLGEGLDFEVPCILYTHAPNKTLTQCIEDEAKVYESLNMSRKNVSSIDKYRAGIAYGDDAALKFEETLIGLGVYVENLGDTEYGIEVRGWVTLEKAWTKYGKRNTKNAINFLKPIYLNTWGKDYIDGSLVYGMTAIYNLMENHLGPKKQAGMKKYLKDRFPKVRNNKWTAQTSGNTDYILISRRIIERYNLDVEMGDIEASPIGERLMTDAGLGDPSKMK